jgi:hypothetical protein
LEKALALRLKVECFLRVKWLNQRYLPRFARRTKSCRPVFVLGTRESPQNSSGLWNAKPLALEHLFVLPRKLRPKWLLAVNVFVNKPL